MKKNLWLLCCIILLVVTIFSGCQEQKAVTTNNFEGITLESSIVELVYASKEFIKEPNSDKVIRVEVQYLFKNIAGRKVSFNVTVEFYDKYNNLLETSPPKNFIDIPAGYVETKVFPVNIISYEGKHLAEVDHVIIKAIER